MAPPKAPVGRRDRVMTTLMGVPYRLSCREISQLKVNDVAAQGPNDSGWVVHPYIAVAHYHLQVDDTLRDLLMHYLNNSDPSGGCRPILDYRVASDVNDALFPSNTYGKHLTFQQVNHIRAREFGSRPRKPRVVPPAEEPTNRPLAAEIDESPLADPVSEDRTVAERSEALPATDPPSRGCTEETMMPPADIVSTNASTVLPTMPVEKVLFSKEQEEDGPLIRSRRKRQRLVIEVQ